MHNDPEITQPWIPTEDPDSEAVAMFDAVEPLEESTPESVTQEPEPEEPVVSSTADEKDSEESTLAYSARQPSHGSPLSEGVDAEWVASRVAHQVVHQMRSLVLLGLVGASVCTVVLLIGVITLVSNISPSVVQLPGQKVEREVTVTVEPPTPTWTPESTQQQTYEQTQTPTSALPTPSSQTPTSPLPSTSIPSPGSSTQPGPSTSVQPGTSEENESQDQTTPQTSTTETAPGFPFLPLPG